ncbi:cell separation during budding [Taxawa tesnikishii (nom. ined.)]|nr:cell separation during budding [Dothideales sp. JES 119]
MALINIKKYILYRFLAVYFGSPWGLVTLLERIFTSFVRLVAFSYYIDAPPLDEDELVPSFEHVARFNYEALPNPESIRLVRVLATTGALTCELTAFPLDHCPQYRALSYTWGNPECPWSFGRPDHSSSTADASAANEDFASSQRLNEYQGSEPMDNTDASSAQSDREDLGINKKSSEVLNHREAFQNPRMLRRLGLEDVIVDDWFDFVGFLERGWFRRVWILQEALLARDIDMFWGPCWMSNEDLMEAIMFFSATPMESELINLLQFHVSDESWVRMPRTATAVAFVLEKLLEGNACGQESYMVAVHNEVSVFGNSAALLDLYLGLASDQQATNPKDKIYGILALLQKSAEQHFDQQYPITVDYGIETAELYTNIVSYIMNHTNSLGLLNKVHGKNWGVSQVTDLPSWVLDYSLPQIHPMCVEMRNLEGNKFNASGTTEIHQSRFSIKGSQLSTLAWIMDEVTATGESGLEMEEGRFEATAQLVLGLPQPYRTGSPWLKSCGER